MTTLVLGCGSKDDVTVSCDKDVSAFEAALTAYTNDISDNNKCLTPKAAAQNVLDCPGITAGQKAEYQDSLDNMVCQ